MSDWRLVLIVVFALAASGGESIRDSTSPTKRLAPQVGSFADAPPHGEPGTLDTRPVWEGFEATHDKPGNLAVYAHGPLDVFETPDAVLVSRTLEPTTILGTATVLGVVTGPVDGWVEVMLPGRPNGSTGWVREKEVSLYVADSKIVIDLAERKLLYLVDGVEVLSTEVGIGSRYNETPTGHFFVTDSVSLDDPNGPWGPHALGLSARSQTITEFNGGDGIIGIHGTNNPGSIGGDISLGCVRLPNEMITVLHALVPIGTRVEISA
jgi:hypothetical protein